MQRIGHPRSPSRARPRVASALAIGLGFAAFGLAWGWATAPLRITPAATSAPVVGPDAIARRAEAAFRDADTATRRAVRGAVQAELVLFRGATSSVCVTGTGGRGVFYCPESGTAALDLAYLDALVSRLRKGADLGVALVAARLAEEHRQRETGVLDAAALDMIGATKARRTEISAELALHADCLTGTWAREAEADLGAVPDGFWSALVGSARNVSDELRASGRPIPAELDTFGAGTREARDAAFRQGYAAGAGACPAPVTLAIP